MRPSLSSQRKPDLHERISTAQVQYSTYSPDPDIVRARAIAIVFSLGLVFYLLVYYGWWLSFFIAFGVAVGLVVFYTTSAAHKFLRYRLKKKIFAKHGVCLACLDNLHKGKCA